MYDLKYFIYDLISAINLIKLITTNANNLMLNSIPDCISSKDPLSDEIINYLVNYREETNFIDYKVAFDNSDREWLEITKDILAFSNTNGGYLLFGVKNGTFDFIGVDEDTVSALGDSSKVMLKINRHVQPLFNSIRCKHTKFDEKNLITIFIPPSYDRTHMISKDGTYQLPSKETKFTLRMGTSYVRQSGGNHLMDSRDLDDVINRRIDYFKQSLMDKISKVVEAPKDSEILIFSRDENSSTNKRFVIQDSSDAIAIKGTSFTVSPTTPEEELLSYSALNSGNPKALPPVSTVWKWYRDRESIVLNIEQKLVIARFSLLAKVPAFYWLKESKAADIEAMLNLSSLKENDNDAAWNIISTGAFISNSCYQSLIKKSGKKKQLFHKPNTDIPHNGPRELFRDYGSKNEKSILLEQLNSIVEKIIVDLEGSLTGIVSLVDRQRAETLDCQLYAKNDKYK